MSHRGKCPRTSETRRSPPASVATLRSTGSPSAARAWWWHCREAPTRSRLAHIVRDLHAAGELRAVGLMHFNHQLRDAAGRDEQFSARLAQSFGWPIVVEREDVAARARRERRSLEDAARTARYEGFDARPRHPGGRSGRARPYPRRSSRDVPSAADPRRRSQGAGRHSPAPRRDRSSAPVLPARRVAAFPRGAGDRLRRGRNQRRREDSSKPGARRAAADAGTPLQSGGCRRAGG